MTSHRLTSLLAVSLFVPGLLAACMTPLPLESALPPPPPPPQQAPPPAAPAPFRAADFAWAAQAGQDRISGHLAFGRGTYTCANASVVLMPETAWFRQRMQVLYGATTGAALPVAQVRARTPATSENYSAYARTVTCDPQSRFVFQGLPNGAWYIITVAHPANGTQGEDMAIMRRVETFSGAVAVEL
jgi:hypothetical protein